MNQNIIVFMFLEQENSLFPDLRKSALQLGPLRHAILQGLGKSGQVMRAGEKAGDEGGERAGDEGGDR